MSITWKQMQERNARNAKEVHLSMDSPEKKNILRSIDISILMDWDKNRIETNPDEQKKLLEEWIKLRGNDQHNTKLTLISWSLS